MSRPSSHSVLLVEDDVSLRIALRTHFVRHGWDAAVASGVREAGTALSLEQFNLIVTDVRMLDGDGFQVLALARSLAPQAAVLFLTASASVPEAVQAVRGGAVDYIAKPIAFDLLLSHAHRVLGEQSSLGAEAVSSAAIAPQTLTRPAIEALPPDSLLPLSMSDLERKHLTQTLERVGGNRTRAAEALGISVRTLRNKVRQYDLPPRRYA